MANSIVFPVLRNNCTFVDLVESDSLSDAVDEGFIIDWLTSEENQLIADWFEDRADYKDVVELERKLLHNVLLDWESPIHEIETLCELSFDMIKSKPVSTSIKNAMIGFHIGEWEDIRLWQAIHLSDELSAFGCN